MIISIIGIVFIGIMKIFQMSDTKTHQMGLFGFLHKKQDLQNEV
jgi:hypothetical protein